MKKYKTGDWNYQNVIFLEILLCMCTRKWQLSNYNTRVKIKTDNQSEAVKTFFGSQSGAVDPFSGSQCGAVDSFSGPQSGAVDSFSGPQSGAVDTFSGPQCGAVDVFWGVHSTSKFSISAYLKLKSSWNLILTYIFMVRGPKSIIYEKISDHDRVPLTEEI